MKKQKEPKIPKQEPLKSTKGAPLKPIETTSVTFPQQDDTHSTSSSEDYRRHKRRNKAEEDTQTAAKQAKDYLKKGRSKGVDYNEANISTRKKAEVFTKPNQYSEVTDKPSKVYVDPEVEELSENQLKNLKKDYGDLTDKELKQIIRLNFREMNKSYDEYLKEIAEGEVESDFYDTQLEKFRTLTGTKSKDGFAMGTLSHIVWQNKDLNIPEKTKKGAAKRKGFTREELLRVIREQEKFLGSKRASSEGRAEIRRKTLETFHRKGYYLTEQNLKKFGHIMNNLPSFARQLREQGFTYMNTLVELVEDETKSYEDIMNALNELDDNISKDFVRKNPLGLLTIMVKKNLNLEGAYEELQRAKERREDLSVFRDN